jgi:NADH-quinone oxidoreductase subunit H
MDFINNIFPNTYRAIEAFLRSTLASWNVAADVTSVLIQVVMGLIVITAILIFAPITMMFLTWLERKIVGRIQNRIGPNRVGPWGLLQPIADMVKILAKEDIIPAGADKWVHLLGPIVLVIPVVLSFAVVPFGRDMAPVDLNIGILFIVALGSLATIGIFMAGYGSNNKFAMMGGMRAVAQIISYEIPQVLAIVPAVLFAGSLSLVKIVDAQGGWMGLQWFVFAIPVGPIAFVTYMLSAIAETNRTPFDLPEAESEIVAGHHTEYSGMKFGLFYLAEYVSLFLVCSIGSTLFLGGWQGPFLPPWIWFLGKTYLLIFVAMWMRGTLPRFRIDQLMGFAWKTLVPLALVNVVLAAALLNVFKSLGF